MTACTGQASASCQDDRALTSGGSVEADARRGVHVLVKNSKTPSLAGRVLRSTLRALRSVPGFHSAEKWMRGRLLRRNLRRLHDALEQTPLAGRYWLFGGMLLGWAREGRLLRHDYRDVDFGYEAADDDRF